MADSGTLEFQDRAGAPIGQLTLLAPAGFGQAGAHDPIITLPPAQAQAAGEAELQILEGLRYEYDLGTPDRRLALKGNDSAGVVCPSRLPGRQHTGTLVPGLATGLMQLALEDSTGRVLAWAGVEVRSRKLDYKADYRQMMEDISRRCVDLLGDWQGASQFKATPDAGADPKTVAQRFAFVRSLLESQGFQDALHRIVSQPHQRWDLAPQQQPVGHGFRPTRATLAQVARGGRRVAVPASHPVHTRLASVPAQITVMRALHTEDTPENRFVKFALRGFQHFLDGVALQLDHTQSPRLAAEVQALTVQLALALDSDVLRHAGNPQTLPLGSPVLQRREGYREVLQAWLHFSLAARLVWQGGEDVYGAGQRDVATLYEYWVFFCLLDLVADLFSLTVPAGANLLEPTGDGFGLKLKAGKFLAVSGTSTLHGRALQVQLSYNRSFLGGGPRTATGSWTAAMRPDCTLSLWPAGFSAEDAEAQELMVHVHFDAKYRVDTLQAMLGDDTAGTSQPPDTADAALTQEKQQQRDGMYKRADLLKMHAYKDAIRRTQGAYVLYPGTADRPFQGFHEVLPGLGAFALRPGAGSDTLKTFLAAVAAQVCNRASASEQQSFTTWRNYQAPPQANEPAALCRVVPERGTGVQGRHTPPRQTWVLAGWCNDDAHLAWVHQSGLYNFRMDGERGSLALSPEVAGASYLLLHGPGGLARPGLLRIKVPSTGPKVFSRQALIDRGYPGQAARQHYLVFEVEPCPEFADVAWDYPALAGKPLGAATGEPFACSLHALMQIARPLQR